MKRHGNHRNWLISVATLALGLALSTSAWAESCETDSDCPEGMACAMSTCPPCESGTECPACDGECVDASGWDETPSIVTNISCETDADCPSSFSCETMELPCATGGGWADCACPECDPSMPSCPPCDCDEEEEPSEPVSCESETVTTCVFTMAECEEDSDCGDGWTCQVSEACYGGGSAGCDCGCVCPSCEPGQECPACDCEEECDCEDDPADFEEQCEVIGAWCAPKEVECTSASDCPADWTCEEVASSSTSSGGVACACADCACEEGDTDCECEPCDCGDWEETDEPTETETISYCLPSGWDALLVEGAIDGEHSTSGPMGESNGGSAESDGAGGIFQDLLGGGKGAGTGDPTAPNNDGGEEGGTNGGGSASNAGGDSGGSGGCSAGQAPASLAWMGFALMGLLWMRRRRGE